MSMAGEGQWKGAAVRRRVIEACVGGVNEVLSKSVISAKENHPGWQNRTATAEGSIRIQSYAAVEGAHIVGKWGSTGVNYFRWLEELHGMALQGAADSEYGGLAGSIKRRLR